MAAESSERQVLISALSKLAESEFQDDAFEWHGELPKENIDLLADRGYLGINIDEAYGGGGLSEYEAMLSIEIVGRICPDTAEYLYTQQMVGPRAIEMFGTEEAKQRYLPPVTAGNAAVAVAISEPEAGSDVGSMNTNVEAEEGSGYILNGEKIWVSHIKHSEAAVVWVKFPEGLGSVIMDLDVKGVNVAQHFTNMAGLTQTQIYMEDVHIPEENILTQGEGGFKEQLKALNWERIGSATLANAWARCAVEKALEYSEDREQFGQPIGDFQGIEWKLADMTRDLEASRALTYRAARNAKQSDGTPDRLDASLAKLTSAEMVERVVSESLQIHGANGYQQGHPLEYLYRLARGRRLAAGTDEIQRNQIAAEIKKRGLPRLL